MRNAAVVLAILAIVMLVLLVRRFMEGSPGPKTWAFCVATLVVIVASFLLWRRKDTPTVT